MPVFLTALGLVFVFEGLVCAFFAGRWKNIAEIMEEIPEDRLRWIGAFVIFLGVLIVWFAQGDW